MKINPHPNCEKCQLFNGCKTPWMVSSGSVEPLVLIVGEAPGENEDKQGVPFVGKAGILLRDTLEAMGLDLQTDVRFTNTVRCRPPDNKITNKAIQACKHYVMEEIEHYNPAMVMLLGNTPLSAVLGESGITTWNGVTAERDGRLYAPLFHPSYINRNMHMLDTWLDAMSGALDKLTAEAAEQDDLRFPSTIQEVQAMWRELLESEWISYDIEGTSLDPFALDYVLLAVSFSNGVTGWAVQLDHVESMWSADDAAIVRNLLRRVLEEHNGKLIGHNVKFDQKHVRRALDVDTEAGGDSMLASYLLDSKPGIHGLKRLAGVYLNMFDYDRELEEYKAAHKEADPDRGGNYGNIPLSLLLPYAAKDALATFKLEKLLRAQLSEEQLDLYEGLIMPISSTLADIEYNGTLVDKFIAQRYADIYGDLQQPLYDNLVNDGHVQVTMAYLQDQADSKIVKEMAAKYGVTPYVDDTHVIAATDTRQYKRQRRIITFNPGSPAQLAALYYKVLRLPVLAYTKTGAPSTSAKVVKVYAKQAPIVADIRIHNLLGKARNTYLLPALNGKWDGADGRARCSYNINGTITGRLSSSKPNLQNIPTPEKEKDTVLEALPVKNIFTHSYWVAPNMIMVDKRDREQAKSYIFNGKGQINNGALVAADYSGMELRVFASLAKCQAMIDIHESGLDFHTMVASDMADIPYDLITKAVRYVYKWTNWTILYDGNEHTLERLYGIPLATGKAAIAKYLRRFPEVVDYKKWARAFATEHGYIQSPFGRREKLPYVNDFREENRAYRSKNFRSAINMPVQSAASDTLLCAMIVINKYLKHWGIKSKLVNTVHDSIVLDCPTDEIDDVVHLCLDVMENIIDYAADYMPQIDFSWLICPLKADVELGTHYGVYSSYDDYVANGKRLI